jgi:hypothetical protein
MAGKKGSMQFSRSRRAMAISASHLRLWSMLRCASRFCGIETAGAGFYQGA